MGLLSVIMLPFFIIYMIPTLISLGKHGACPWTEFVFGVNLFLGWTGIGWLFALGLANRE